MFFGWGLLLALTSVFAAQPLERRFGLVPTLAVALAAVAADLLIGGLFLHDQTVLILVVIVSGARGWTHRVASVQARPRGKRHPGPRSRSRSP